MIGDSAYSGKDNLKKARDEHFKLVAKLNPSISQGFRKGKDKFDYNKDAGMFVYPAGQMAIRRAKQGRKNRAWNQAYTYYFDVHKCLCCSKLEGVINRELNLKPILYPLKPMSSSEQVP